MARGGGESYVQFAVRVEAALGAIRARLSPGGHALVVCHGGIVLVALAGALGLGGPAQWAFAHPTNTSITRLSYAAGGPALHAFNDSLHLLPLGNWPPYAEVSGVVGLVSGDRAGDGLGAFAARYDAMGIAEAPAAAARSLGRPGRLRAPPPRSRSSSPSCKHATPNSASPSPPRREPSEPAWQTR